MRSAVLICYVFWAACFGATAAPIELHKGIATDIWVSWPDEKRLQAEPDLINHFPEWIQTIGPKQISNLRKAGFDFVRLTIDPQPYIWQVSPEKTAKLNANVLKAIQLFRDQDLKVLVDFHSIPTGGYREFGIETYLQAGPQFAQFVEQSASLAKALSGLDPQQVAYEPINEPVLDCEYDEGGNKHRWQKMALQLHKAVRAAAPDLTLVIQGSCWGGSAGLADLDPASFKDDNIIWDFHSYDPFMFTHQGAEWTTGPERYISGLRFPPKQSQKAAIIAQTLKRIKKADVSADRKKQLLEEAEYNLNQYFANDGAIKQHQASFEQVEAWARANKVPPNHILLGEFGANRTDETAKTLLNDRLAFVKRSRTEAEKRGYAWSFWDWSGSMSPTNNDQDREMLPSYIHALGLVPRD